MRDWRSGLSVVAVLAAVLALSRASAEDWAGFPEPILTVLENSRPLVHSRGDRLPLFLWPVQGGVVKDEALQEKIIRALDTRGIAMISSWVYENREQSLTDSIRIARIQQRLGLLVCVNANNCMYGFSNGAV